MTLHAASRLSAGPDGVCDRAVDNGRAVLVHVLVKADDARRTALKQRLRVAAGVTDAGVLAPVRVDLDVEPPYVVHEDVTGSLRDLLSDHAGIAPERAHHVALQLARTVAAGHRHGLAHGDLRPGAVRLGDDDVPRVLLVELRTGRRDADPLDDAVAPADPLSPRPADDVRAVALLLVALLSGRRAALSRAKRGTQAPTAPTLGEGIEALLDEALHADADARPTMAELAKRLQLVAGPKTVADDPRQTVESAIGTPRDPDPARLGRFQVMGLLGEGAMGRVYRAVDDGTGAEVAIKVMPQDRTPSARALQRFRKEARLLGEVRSPGVARLLDFGDADGVTYLAVELVRGTTLAQLLKQRGPLPEAQALALVADVAKSLIDVHTAGVIHRDLKPDNLIVVDEAAARLKIIDFGVARHVDEHESLAMTRLGAVIGTPLYMAPEQARGAAVDARTDVYAMGVILFELLTGKPPFAGGGSAHVIAAHLEVVPPKVSEVVPQVSEEAAAVVARCLEKEPSARPASARALLDQLEPLLGHKTVEIGAHPRAPSDEGVKRYVFEWRLKSSPRVLWPQVSNTERLNRAIGLGAVHEEIRVENDDVAMYGSQRQATFQLAWREQPYEWVSGRRLGVLREYTKGPLRWLKSTVDLHPDGEGTRLVHTIEIEPRSLLGRAAAAVEIGVRTRLALERVYSRIDALAQGRLQGSVVRRQALIDAFEDPPALSAGREARLLRLERAAVAMGAPADAVAAVGDALRFSPPQEVARLRPIELGARLGIPADDVVHACLVGAHLGMLTPLWDILCPSCRAPASIADTLRALRDHGRCEVCNLDFALDLAASIEMVFGAHAQIRESDPRTYCMSSPAHTPHVLAQVRLEPGERFLLKLDLESGNHRLAVRRLSWSWSFRARAGGPTRTVDVDLGRASGSSLPALLGTKDVELSLHNTSDRVQTIRLERADGRDDALTAARAIAHPLFRQLFPGEVLEPGALVKVSAVTLLLAEAKLPGGDTSGTGSDVDAVGYPQQYALFKVVEEAVTRHQGAVVKILGDGILAVFDDPERAVATALALPAAVRASHGRAVVRAAVHAGPAAAVTLNERLDYFGKTTRVVSDLLKAAGDDELVVSPAVAEDAAVIAAVPLTGAAPHRVQLPLVR